MDATLPEDASTVEAPDAWSKLRKQIRARLLQKVYEVDPFITLNARGQYRLWQLSPQVRGVDEWNGFRGVLTHTASSRISMSLPRLLTG